MLRRPLAVPYGDVVPVLAELIVEGAIRTPCAEDRLVEAASFHRVVGYLEEALKAERLTLGPEARHRALARRSSETAQGDRLRWELGEILPVIQHASGVAPVLIKGPAVADRFYPHARLRSFRDLDLIVPRSRLGAAAQAMGEALGYRRLEEPWPGYGERHGHHIALARRVGGSVVAVELHWRMSADPVTRPLDHALLLAHSETLCLDQGSVAVPSVEDQLLLLAVHLLHEDQKRLAWINDLVLCARATSEPQWRAAFERAEQLGLAWVLHRALDYAAAHLGLRRERPGAAGSPPPWGPLRANERFEGWTSLQVGQLSLGGWSRRDGYVRSAIRARRLTALRRLRTSSPETQ